MSQSFPHRYHVALKRHPSQLCELHYNDAVPLTVSPPPEFDGPRDQWSPEGALLAAVLSCYVATAKGISRRLKVELQDYELDCEGVLEKTKMGLRFTAITIAGKLYVDDPEKAGRLVESAKEYCLVSNALNVTPELRVELHRRD